jgi:hypothetical protein
MNRRDFLLLKANPRTHAMALSCEELYMRFLDSQLDNTTAELFARLDGELRRAEVVQLVDPWWLADAGFRQALDRVLAAFRAGGGQVVAARTESLPAIPPRPH